MKLKDADTVIITLLIALQTLGTYYNYDLPASISSFLLENLTVFQYNWLYSCYQIGSILSIIIICLTSKYVALAKQMVYLQCLALAASTLFLIGAYKQVDFTLMLIARTLLGISGQIFALQIQMIVLYIDKKYQQQGFICATIASRVITIVNFHVNPYMYQQFGLISVCIIALAFQLVSLISSLIITLQKQKYKENNKIYKQQKKQEIKQIYNFNKITILLCYCLFYSGSLPFISQVSYQYLMPICNYTQYYSNLLISLIFIGAIIILPLFSLVYKQNKNQCQLLSFVCFAQSILIISVINTNNFYLHILYFVLISITYNLFSTYVHDVTKLYWNHMAIINGLQMAMCSGFNILIARSRLGLYICSILLLTCCIIALCIQILQNRNQKLQKLSRENRKQMNIV